MEMIKRIAKRRRQLSLGKTRTQKSSRRTQAVWEQISEKAAKKAGGAKTTRQLRKKVAPRIDFFGKIADATVVKRRMKTIRKLFGNQGQRLGFMVISPEAFGFAPEIRRTLNSIGCKIVFSKNVSGGKSEFNRVYGWKNSNEGFAQKALIFESGPSKVIVFKQLPTQQYMNKSKYLALLQAANPAEHRKVVKAVSSMTPQDAFSKLFKGRTKVKQLGTIRTDIIENGYERLGLSEKPFALGKKLDVIGYYEKKGRRPMLALSGIHTPDAENLVYESAIFLNQRDLKKIEEMLRK